MKIVENYSNSPSLFFKDAPKKALQDSKQPPYLHIIPLQVEIRKSEMLEDTDATLSMMVKLKLSGLVQSYRVLFLKQVQNTLIITKKYHYLKGPAYGNVSFSVNNSREFTKKLLKDLNIYWIENLEFGKNVSLRFVIKYIIERFQ